MQLLSTTAMPSPNHLGTDDRPKYEPLAYRVEDAMRVSGLGRTKIYEALNSGALKSRLVGRRRLIDAASLRALVTGEVA